LIGLLDLFPLCQNGNSYFSIIELSELLYILEIKPLLVTLFANIFSKSIGCLLALFMVFFAAYKFD